MNTLAPETGFLFAGICYVAWWYLCGKIITKGLFSIHASKGTLGYVLYKRILAVFFFFLLPLVFLRFTHQNFLDWFSLSNVYETAIVSIAISAPLIIINLINGKQAENLQLYPEIRTEQWDGKLILLSAVSWIAYLIAYEFLFRGCMFFLLLKNYNFTLALVINVIVYSFAHFPKNMRETLAALPFGAILCWACSYTENIWPAIIAHIVLALSNEWIALYAITREKRL
ncbi:MAG: CPBP family intramembrane glutamic endopeptidase [Bacteroidales bacterium]